MNRVSVSLKVGLLLLNSVLILNRRRFLAKYGLDDLTGMGGGAQNQMKAQAVGLLHAIQYLRVPVIAANLINITFELFFGG